MKARGALIQGVLAVGALVVAYATWQRAPETAAGDVVVLDYAKSAIEKIRLEDGPRWIELTRRTEGSEPEIWLRQGAGEIRVAAPSDGGTADAGTVVVSPEQKPRLLRGNERAEKAFERFAPLRAVRALGALSPEKQKELGFEGSKRRLSIDASGSAHVFKVASATPGFGAPYLQDEKSAKVFLLNGALLSELDPGSQQLVDRRLHGFKPGEFDAFTVKVGGDQKEFVQTGAELPATTKVAAKASPDKPDECVRNWHDKVWSRMITTVLYGQGELPPSGEPKPTLRIDYASRGKPKGWLEIAQGSGTEIFARSENTAGWVMLHGGASEVVAEAKKVVGAK